MLDFQHYLKLAIKVSEQGTCLRRKIGCILVDEKGYILAEGYNGRPKVLGTCLCEPCPGAYVSAGTGDGKTSCFGVHAEIRALINYSKLSTVRNMYALFSTKAPCFSCVVTLLETPCKYIVFRDSSNEVRNEELWKSDNRDWIQLEV